MKRRDLLKAAAAVPPGWIASRAALTSAAPAPGSGAPFGVLYGNDLTNVVTCVSPYHKAREPFTTALIQANVDEVAAPGSGELAHLLQPGVGWVPLWQSKALPIEEHYAWLLKRYNLKPDSLGRYVLEGGDVVKEFVAHCRKRGQTPFVSMRMNDAHGKEFADAAATDKQRPSGHAVNRFYDEHRAYRIGPSVTDWNQRVLNWAVPEVREFRFAFLREIAEGYDIDGLELDYLRQASFFRLDETPPARRAAIMTGFVKRVRELLDRTAGSGRKRWLSVRIPAHRAALEPLGLDLQQLADSGVEMFNFSCHYFTEQQVDAPGMARQCPSVSSYLEMTHTTHAGKSIASGSADTFSFRRTTDEQFYTTAHLAYARGLSGVSLFNFVYYREHGSPERGPFNEPPFHVLGRLGDRAWLAQQPQHWILAHVWDEPAVPNRQMGSDRKPREVAAGQTVRLTMDMAPPEGGWKHDGRLRLQTRGPLGTSRLAVKVNDAALDPAADISEPYASPYTPLLGTAETLRAWTLPHTLLRDGVNTIDVTRADGKPARLIFVDIAVG